MAKAGCWIPAGRLTEIGADLLFRVRTTQTCGRGMAFAAILGDGSVMTFGQPDAGGDCSAVQDRLKNAQCIQASEDAFAAIGLRNSRV